MSEKIQEMNHRGEMLTYFDAESNTLSPKRKIVSFIWDYIRTFLMPPEEIIKYLEEVRWRVEEIKKQAN